MPYSKFNLANVQQKFSLTLRETRHFLNELLSVEPDELLRATLQKNIPIALTQGNEKARSEWIINLILTAVRRLASVDLTVFSGREFTVDAAQDLAGYVDFLIARSPRLLILEASILMLVEAKPENLNAGLGQCTTKWWQLRFLISNLNKPLSKPFMVVSPMLKII